MKKSMRDFILKNWLELILSIPKTIYINFRVLPVREAFKFPIIISYHIKLIGVNRNSFHLKAEHYKFASTRIGLGTSRFSVRESKKGLIHIKNGEVIIYENAGFSQGVVIDAVNATINFGKHFRCNYSSTISAVDEDIVFGDDVVLGWNVVIKNNDGHYIVRDGKTKKNSGKICIGNNVWICAEATVLKSTIIGNSSVVAYRSLVSGNALGEDNVLYAGIPAKVIKRNIDWKE